MARRSGRTAGKRAAAANANAQKRGPTVLREAAYTLLMTLVGRLPRGYAATSLERLQAPARRCWTRHSRFGRGRLHRHLLLAIGCDHELLWDEQLRRAAACGQRRATPTTIERHLRGPAVARCRHTVLTLSCRHLRCVHGTTGANVAGRGINHLRRSRGWPVAQAVVRRAEVRAA